MLLIVQRNTLINNSNRYSAGYLYSGFDLAAKLHTNTRWNTGIFPTHSGSKYCLDILVSIYAFRNLLDGR